MNNVIECITLYLTYKTREKKGSKNENIEFKRKADCITNSNTRHVF